MNKDGLPRRTTHDLDAVPEPRARNLVVSDVPARWADQHLRGDPAPGDVLASCYRGLVTLRFDNYLLPDGSVVLEVHRR